MRRMERRDDEWTPGDRPASGPPDAPAAEAMPRWVKVSLIAVGVFVVLLVILMASGLLGGHGPGRHLSAPVVAVATSACGDRPVDRALTGGAIGAAGGAVVGSTVGNPVAGAVVGGVGGAAVGAATAPTNRTYYD